MERKDAVEIFMAGVNAVKPQEFIPRYIQLQQQSLIIGDNSFDLIPGKSLYVAAVGKAAAAMAEAVEKIVGNHITDGLVVTKYRHGLPLNYCKTIEAGHPLPDDNSVEAGRAMLAFFEKASENDLIIFLVSGGASALVADVPGSCSLADLSQTIQLLLDCGADITEMNTVRKHLSQLKGGQLMRHTKARVEALLLSDVPGDDLSVIASGLTVADTSSFKDAWQVIIKYSLQDKVAAVVRNWLQAGLRGNIVETPKAGDAVFERVTNTLVASNRTALKAAANQATLLGYRVLQMPSVLQGDAVTQARYFVQQLNKAGAGKYCYLWGGETTVVVKGKGKGGRNQQFALAALAEMATGDVAMTVVAGGTDGTDGPTDATGAVADQEVISKADVLQLDPVQFLEQNDAYHFFENTKGLIITGPTQTNVMDIVVGLVNNDWLTEKP